MSAQFFKDMTVTAVHDCAKIYTTVNQQINCPKRRLHGLVYFLEGEIEYQYPQKTVSAVPGSILFLPCGVPYLIHRPVAAQCMYINFSTLEPTRLEPFSKVYPNNKSMCDCFSNAIQIYRQKRVGYEAELSSIVYKIISLIQSADSAGYMPRTQYRKIQPAVKYIHEQYYNGNIRVAQLAELSGISARYFTQIFSAYYGVSPKEYIIRLQLDMACNMLTSTKETIGDIAVSCGFSDIYYFCKTFHKTFGMPATEYRRLNSVI